MQKSYRIDGVFDIYTISKREEELKKLPKEAVLELDNLKKLDTAGALFLVNLAKEHSFSLKATKKEIVQTLELVKRYPVQPLPKSQHCSFLERIGYFFVKKYIFLVSFLSFIGELFIKKLSLFFNPQYFRYKEILYEINQSALKALGIVALTSFLVGVVVAYQSAVQLRLYGANIFIVDMLGISILRELAPMITAIVIAGRSGSAYTAEIGAMKITQELDAMRTMGFDPYYYLVIPRIFALMISLPILIFVADIAGVFGGLLIAHTQLGISFGLFIERFRDVIDVKHLLLGELKGPFFGFLIATIAIYRGFIVEDDTQSIGKHTTKSVVESIFIVIVCDAVFSVIFTHLGL
ncbi:FIG00761799: membrane protein [hydrothermal vent metagenome]|uniref:FIG00761799: membrane protein n=1 Tax=hydrothermal vent metagenome TaxID=652676 RepID=A0A1W1BRW9_9ZZZZ